jgi:hypothetical protein
LDLQYAQLAIFLLCMVFFVGFSLLSAFLFRRFFESWMGLKASNNAVIANKKLEIAVNVLCGVLLGSLIFLIAAMDNPFRGELSVSPQSFQLLIDGVMKQQVKGKNETIR